MLFDAIKLNIFRVTPETIEEERSKSFVLYLPEHHASMALLSKMMSGQPSANPQPSMVHYDTYSAQVYLRED